MKIEIVNDCLIEALRLDEDRDLFSHLVNDCDWSEDDASDCAAINDFYILEVRATRLDNLEQTASVYLGGIITKCWETDTTEGAGGYLSQMIEEALGELSQ